LGCRLVHNNRFTDPDTVLKLVCDHGVTTCAAVPAIWQVARQALMKNPQQYKGKFKVRQIICGGSAPPNEMMKWYWDEYSTEFIQVWGMTETTPFGTVARQVSKLEHTQWTAEQKFSNVTKTGIAVPTVEMKIVDTEDFSKELPHDGIAQGELLVRGPHITGKYYNTEQGTFPDGWLATGDIASIDKEGYMMIRDRSKDVIKSGGEWISSKDLEAYIMGIPSVAMAAVVAHPHPKWDERPVCVLVPAEGMTPPTLDEVKEFCVKDGVFAKYECPDDVLVWDAIPMTGTGKMDKKTIRSRLQKEGYLLPDQRSKL